MILRYCSGSDYLVVGPTGGCLTPDRTAAERVWPLVRDGEPIAAWLAELLTDGLALLPDFVLFEIDGPGLRAILRGATDLTVDLPDGSAETCSGLSFRTWVERVFPAVTGGIAGRASDPDLPLVLGVVLAGGLRFGPPGSAVAERPAEPSAAPVVTRAPQIVPPVLRLPGPINSPEPINQIEPSSSESLVGEDLPVRAAPTPEALGETRSEEPEPQFGHVYESTILRKVENTHLTPLDDGESVPLRSDFISRVPSSAPRPGVPDQSEPDVAGPAGRQLGDHDGSTIMAGQLAALRAAVGMATPATDAVVSMAPAVLALSDGSRIRLDKAVILGRRPQVDRVSSADLPYLVTVSSPNQDISRNHLQVRPGATTLLAADLHATNGTLLRRADGSVVEITNGAEVSIAVGDLLELGDGVVARIEAG